MTTDLGNPHDRFFKEIWSRKRVSRDFLRHYLPAAVVALLDLNTLELTKDSFIDQRLREYYSDLLYRVQLKNGTSAFVYLLLEHKRQAERLTVIQVLRYIVQIWESPLAQIEGKTVLPPVIPIVVYHGTIGDRPRIIMRLCVLAELRIKRGLSPIFRPLFSSISYFPHLTITAPIARKPTTVYPADIAYRERDQSRHSRLRCRKRHVPS